MPELTYEQVFAPTGNQPNGMIWGLVGQLRNKACEIYNNNAQWAVYSPLGSSDPLAPIRGNLWDRICPNSPPPPTQPPHEAPFLGGQCPVYYTVETENELPPQPAGGYESHNVLGPFSLRQDLQGWYDPQSCDPGQHRVTLSASLVDADGNLIPLYGASGVCATQAYYNFPLFRVTRNDGQPDNCGNSDGVILPPPQAPSDTSGTGVVTGTNGVPYEYNYVLNYDPTIYFPTPYSSSHDYSNDPNFNVNFTINNSYTVSFNHYGVSYNFGDSAAINAPQSSAGIAAAGNSAQSAANAANAANATSQSVKMDTQQIIVVSNQAKACSCSVSNNTNPAMDKPRYILPRPQKQNLNVVQLYGIEIDTDTVPGNAPVQHSDDTAPDIYWIGYVQFSSAGYFYPRQPISFLKTVFKAPDGADGYAVFFKAGYDGIITEITN